jgi:parallel beta-helix repeat protein
MAAILGTMLAAHATATESTTFVVDDDHAQCPNAEFETIQKAVDQAAKLNSDKTKDGEPRPNNDVHLISVCPGVYAEQVTVRTSVTIRGVPETVSAIDCFGAAVALDPTRHAIVDGAGSVAQDLFSLEADNIELQGFVIKDAWTSVPRPPNFTTWRHGIDASATYSGYNVHHNLFMGNTVAILFRSSGVVPSRFGDNCLRDNAWGVANEWLPLIDARIHHNSTLRTENFAYEQTSHCPSAAASGDATGCSPSSIGMDSVVFDHNLSMSDNTAYRFTASRATTASDNTVTDARIGIRLVASNVGLQIIGNQMEVRDVGLARQSTPAVPPNFGTLIEGNTIIGAPGLTGIGIGTGGLKNSRILNNVVSGFKGGAVGACNGCGIAFSTGNTDNVVTGNTVVNNARDGIQVAAGATNNTFQENTFLGNGILSGVDARDLNTTLPLNVWISNICATDFPAGTICAPTP